MEMNQGLKEKSEKFEKEKQSLQDKNKELSDKNETLTAQLEESKAIQQRQEEELKDGKHNKELLSQVSHCIYFYSDMTCVSERDKIELEWSQTTKHSFPFFINSGNIR